MARKECEFINVSSSVPSNAENEKSSTRSFRIPVDEPKKDDTDLSCPICLETIDNDRCPAAVTICGHTFCQTCLQRTLEIKPYCPICRQYQQRDETDLPEQERLNEHVPWDFQVVRAFFRPEIGDEFGTRRVCLSNGEQTNIFVQPNVKIRVDPNVNLVINGKRIQNPSECNQQ